MMYCRYVVPVTTATQLSGQSNAPRWSTKINQRQLGGAALMIRRSIADLLARDGALTLSTEVRE